MTCCLVIPWKTWKRPYSHYLWKHGCTVMDVYHKAPEGWHSFRTFPSLPVVAKFNWISLGCRFPDSFCRHAWQVAWKIDIKDGICASIAKFTSLHVSCCRRHTVSFYHCYCAELVILLCRNLVNMQCVTSASHSIPPSPCVVFSIASASSEFNFRFAWNLSF